MTEAICRTDTLCIFDSTPAVQGCVKACVLTSTFEQCTARSVCTWDPVTNICTSKALNAQCSRFETTSSCVAGGCRWLATGCTNLCQQLYGDAASTAQDPTCVFLAGRGRSNCTVYFADTCSSDLSCVLSGSTCVNVCSYSSHSSCIGDSQCYWNTAGVCVKSCQLSEASLCGTRPECAVSSGGSCALAIRGLSISDATSPGCVGIHCAWSIALIAIAGLVVLLLFVCGLLWFLYRRCRSAPTPTTPLRFQEKEPDAVELVLSGSEAGGMRWANMTSSGRSAPSEDGAKNPFKPHDSGPSIIAIQDLEEVAEAVPVAALRPTS